MTDNRDNGSPKNFEDHIAQCNRKLEEEGRVAGSRDERIWAAGFFDGEGHVSARPTSGFDCSIDQIEEDLINLVRFRNAVGVGSLTALKPRENSRQRLACRWAVSSKSDLEAVFAAIGPYLNPTKRDGRPVQQKSLGSPPNDGFARALAATVRVSIERDANLPEGMMAYEPLSKRSVGEE